MIEEHSAQIKQMQRCLEDGGDRFDKQQHLAWNQDRGAE